MTDQFYMDYVMPSSTSPLQYTVYISIDYDPGKKVLTHQDHNLCLAGHTLILISDTNDTMIPRYMSR